MTSAISCPLWSSVYECQIVECPFTSPVRTECGMFVMFCIQCCMLYALFNHPRLLIQVARVQKAQFSYRLDGLVP